jgi:hypothetical protein
MRLGEHQVPEKEALMKLSQVQRWLRSAFRRLPDRPRRHHDSRARLLLECLEGRTLPSTVTWINPGGGDWDTASNWLDSATGTNHVPTANDDAVISTAGITVTHSSFFNADTVNSLTSQANLAVSNGSLTFNTASTAPSLTLSGGTVNVASPDPANPGSLEVGTLNQSGGTLTGAGTVTVDTALLWTGGTMSGSGSTEVLGAGEVGGGSPFGPTLSGRTLDNFGAFTVDNGSNLLFASNATLNNRPGGLLVLQGAANLGNFFGSSGKLNNAGALAHPGSGTTAAVGIAFDNTGAVDVQAGTLNAPVGLTNEGTLTLEVGTTATFTGGSSSGDFNLQVASHLTLNGNFTLLSGSTTEVGLVGQLELDGVTLNGGAAVTGPGSVTVGGFSGQMAVSNGAATIDNLSVSGGTVTINAGASLEVGTLAQSGGTLTGAGTLTVDSSLLWTGGTMSGSGSTEVLGAGEVGGGSPFGPTLSGRTLDNFGTFTVDGGSNLLFASNATLNNQPGGTLVLQGAANLGNFFGSSGKLNNAGTLTHPGSGTTAAVDIAFDNTGAVDVQAGTLNAPLGLTNEGTLTLEPGAAATLTGGSSSGDFNLQVASHLTLNGNFTLLSGSTTEVGLVGQLELDGATLNGGAAVTGAGSVTVGGFSGQMAVSNGAATIDNLTVSGGTVTINANASLEVGTLNQSGGTITGAGTLTVDNALVWTGGTMSGAGSTEVQGAGEVGGGSPFGPTLSGRTLDNFGAFTVDGGSNLLFASNATLNNQPGGTLVLGNNTSLGNFFGSSGKLNNAGLIEDTGSTHQATINLSAPVANSGTISLQGILNISGAYTQTADGTLNIVLSPGSPVANGELKVSGQATLDGTLNVTTQGTISPTAGETFTIMTFNGVTGDFANFTGLDLGNGLTLAPSHNNSSYALTVTAS